MRGEAGATPVRDMWEMPARLPACPPCPTLQAAPSSACCGSTPTGTGCLPALPPPAGCPLFSALWLYSNRHRLHSDKHYEGLYSFLYAEYDR